MPRKTAAAGGDDYRDSQADLMRAKRQSARIVIVPKCADRDRRELLESDDEEWLAYYFAPESGCDSPFTYSFTQQQREMIAAIRTAIVEGGDQALGASRGEGKTTYCERLILKYTLQGKIRFSVLFAATGSAAEDSLDSIKNDLENNSRLREDYPEVCVPVESLENTPNRAHYQMVSGDRHDTGKPYEAAQSKFSWCGQEIVFPNVPGSPSAGSIIATRGLDSAVRGVKKKGKRVDVAVIDDPDTEETARSEEQAKKLEDRIDKAIGGLGSQKRRVARVMLTTLQSRISASFRFTDPLQKQSWMGKRFRFLVEKPERIDLWDEYVQLRKKDWENKQKGDATHAAHEFYVANREAMDAGAVVANPNRYTQGELSALQFYYNEVARLSPEAVATEYDNDPPEEDGPIESGISAGKIQARLSGYARGVIPSDCVKLSRGIDLQKAGAHWVIKAWKSDASFYVIDYGFHESHGTIYGSDEGLEFAVRRVILELAEAAKDNPYLRQDGTPVPLECTLIDSGWQAATVYQACAEIGLGYYPSKGHGKSHGCATPNFHDQWTRTKDRKPGDGWFQSRLPGNLWLVHCDTDRWKSFEHARWMTPEGKPGAAYLFGEISDEERRYLDKRMPRDAKDHHGFARHLTAEIEVEETVRGQLKRFWKVKAGRVQNHYLDASYLADVAASMLGVRLLGEAKSTAGPAPTARELANMARR